ncbi:formylglycine-generating enzyme family protein [Planctomycetes bacterium K23_9]|uniref:Serine/threonine-protein kinase pkn1 n=1 Tax=Stieleria marina TaxID=1930275 RepID=A0A517NM16_9BACT|nr:Serine/threonine-protein kinase pkn1 [Planctomycetes bacterium K23_9]
MSLATLFFDTVGFCNPLGSKAGASASGFPDVSSAPPDTRRLIRDRRYCRVLTDESVMPLDECSLSCAWKAVEHDMALVPGGDVRLTSDTIVSTPSGFETVTDPANVVSVQSLYLDRDCVTNGDYLRFVQAGGYVTADYWPEDVLPNVLHFLDSTGSHGPKYWVNGKPDAAKLDHPVVGLSWYEANAYAAWIGKRLPTSEEWQRAGTWPEAHAGGGTELRYPWGNAFDPSKANTWAGGIGETVSVRSYETGNTPNGVRQLVGNVWEWVDVLFHPQTEQGVSVLLDQTMAEIRGGSFDTYFHSQATCQFRTGQPLLFRGANIGFRCCVSASALTNLPESPTESIQS